MEDGTLGTSGLEENGPKPFLEMSSVASSSYLSTTATIFEEFLVSAFFQDSVYSILFFVQAHRRNL